MEAVFLGILDRNIKAGWVIAAVLLLRVLLKRAPKGLICLLWALVAVRLLSPFSVESAFSLMPAADPAGLFTARYAQGPADQSSIGPVGSVVDPAVHGSLAPTPEASADPLDVWAFAAGVIWAVGLAGFLGAALVSYLRIRSQVREAVPLEAGVWLCDAVRAPFILGIIRPRIYLPSDIAVQQMRYVTAHERAHLARKDHWWKAAAYLLLAWNWIDPLVWAAHILFCRDIELACDERAVRDADLEERKAYSQALLSCSTKRRLVFSCPLAFGEVGVKERVKRILAYRKPAFWITVVTVAACAAAAVCFLTDPGQDAFDMRIDIPAGSQEPFYYADGQISPVRGQITISSGEGLGDTEVVLIPLDLDDGTDPRPMYLTPGMPVRAKLQKGAWYRIGVAVSAAPDTDRTVYVHVDGAAVRIAGRAEGQPEMVQPVPADTQEGSAQATAAAARAGSIQDGTYVQNDGIMSPEEAIRAAILAQHHAEPLPYEDLFTGCSFVVLEEAHDLPQAGSPDHMIVYYGWELYEEYKITEKGIEYIRGSHIPAALTFALDEDGYHLRGYWRPGEGSYLVADIREKFPQHIVDDALDSQKYIIMQKQDCYQQAIEHSGLDTVPVIESLIDTVCSGPAASSDPQDYLDAHLHEYRELLCYGDHTLRYCLRRFQQGDETGLEGRIMAVVCGELLQVQGRVPDAADGTGQSWYDALYAHGPNIIEPYLE